MKVELTIHATCSGVSKTFHTTIDKPIFRIDECVGIVKSDVFQDPTGIAKKFLEYYGVGINFIRTKTREEQVVRKRQKLCWFLYTYSLMSTKDIGSIVNTDHATVSHSAYTVNNDIKHEKGFADEIESIRAYCGLEKVVRHAKEYETRYKKKYKQNYD